MRKSISVVIPAYDEELSVASVVEEYRRCLGHHQIEAEIIVVDDGSHDHTAQAAMRAGARVIRHRSNRGYGASLKTGIAAATFDVVAITDADGTYPAEYIPQMLEALERSDMVVGARTGKKSRVPLVRRPAKWILNRLANYLSSAHIPDLNSGLRVFRRDVVLQYFSLLPDQFSWTTTITLAMHCDKYAVSYLSIQYRERKGRSKIVPWDAGSFFVLILRTTMLFRPLRVLLPLVFVFFAYGATKMTIDVFRDPMISASAVLTLMGALIILLIGMLGDAIAARLGRLSPNAVLSIHASEVVPLEAEELAEDSPPQGERKDS
jgi:glycosyltransferase involved in cell wall biosynthesis